LFKLDDTPTDLPIRAVIRALTVRTEERLGSFEKFADAIHGVVGCEDIIGSLAAKRFHNSNKEERKLMRASAGKRAIKSQQPGEKT
jgi:hypothetical protein